MTEYQHKRDTLIRYIRLYLSKNLNMNIVLVNIVNQLKDNKTITPKQFNSVIKFLEREPQFLGMNRDQIRRYFNTIISPTVSKETFSGNTLCEFFGS